MANFGNTSPCRWVPDWHTANRNFSASTQKNSLIDVRVSGRNIAFNTTFHINYSEERLHHSLRFVSSH